MSLKTTTACILSCVIILMSCKKPKNGEYAYDERGLKSSYLSENNGPYNLVKKIDYVNTNNVKFKNKHNKTLLVDNVEWTINGDSAIYVGNTNSSPGPNNTITSAYSYRGHINNKKEIEGIFIIVQLTKSYTNKTLDTLKGTFTYKRK